MRSDRRAKPCDHRIAQRRRLDHSYLWSVRGEFIGEDVHVDERHMKTLYLRRRTTTETQECLSPRSDLNKRHIACGYLVEPGQSAIASAFAKSRIERLFRHRDVANDPAEQEGALVIGIRINAIHMPARFVVDESQR